MSHLLPADRILAQNRPGDPPRMAVPLGRSREGREIRGFCFGNGPRRISLIAGCHADEPVGPALLDKLVSYLTDLSSNAPELQRATWYVVPHVNPDGEARNASWTNGTTPVRDFVGEPDCAYDALRYHKRVVRELPGDDLEFGFPRDTDDVEARPEALAVASFLRRGAPFALHASLHGMAVASGPWFLLEPAWIERTHEMRRSLRHLVRRMGYRPFDVDRRGEKGFRRIDEGFSTRPDSRAMVSYFLEQGDRETAVRFRPSSMEFLRSLGGDPLTLVSEMPLFLLPEDWEESAPHQSSQAPSEALDEGSVGRRFLEWMNRMEQDRAPDELRQHLAELGVRPMPIRDQMRLQIAFLNAGLEAVQA